VLVGDESPRVRRHHNPDKLASNEHANIHDHRDFSVRKFSLSQCIPLHSKWHCAFQVPAFTLFAMRLSITAPLFLKLATADWQFKSRPDLAPPRLNITIPAAPNVEQGYLFIAPFAGYPDTATEQHGPRQAAPYIFRDNGDLIWSGYGYYSIWATNFQAGRWNGKDVLFSFEGDHNPGYGHGHGHTTILDKHYETICELRAGNHKLTDKHEFHIVSEDTAVIQVYQPVPRDLRPWGASAEQQWIVNAIFQGTSSHFQAQRNLKLTKKELNITSGELLFEWASLDHVSPDGKSSGCSPHRTV
jgi:hypothetical protein